MINVSHQLTHCHEVTLYILERGGRDEEDETTGLRYGVNMEYYHILTVLKRVVTCHIL